MPNVSRIRVVIRSKKKKKKVIILYFIVHTQADLGPACVIYILKEKMSTLSGQRELLQLIVALSSELH